MIVPDTKWQPDLTGRGRSKYKALADAIRDGIVNGDLVAGAKLPPVRELAFRVGVTPGTVARAYTMMTDEGRLVAEVGRGTFVAGPDAPRDVADVPLINTVDDTTADFRSSRVPDVGQGRLIDDAMERLAVSHRRRHINYPTPETDLEAREAILDWTSQIQMGAVSVEDVVLANGAQNATILAMLAELKGQTPVILTEDLSYPGGRHAARLLRTKIVGVAMDEDGLRPDALLAAIREHGGQVLLTSPNVHSPTTIRTTLARKQEIADLARRHNITIIEDDCHGSNDAGIPAYRAILPEQSYYLSSLTKSVSGALRFGFCVAPTGRGAVLRQVAQSAHYGVSQPVIDICTDLIVSGAADRIRAKVAKAVAERARITVNLLGRWDIKWREDAPFVYLTLPQGWRASRFMVECERLGILVKPADEFALTDARAPNAVRLAIGTCVSEDRFVRALRDMDDLLAKPSVGIEA